MRAAAQIALTHHERYDGTGYPGGLVGEDIPLFGRICALSDVFDALTSVRPYKEAWKVADALTEMTKGAGTQFDSRLFDAFRSAMPDILELKERYAGETSSQFAELGPVG